MDGLKVLVATESHYQVEVFAKTKKIYIEKEKISMANDVVGSLTTDSHRRQQSATVFSQATPYMQGATPTHGSATTPMHSGSETPKIGTPRGNNTPRGASTPGVEEAYDPWKMSSLHGLFIHRVTSSNLLVHRYFTPISPFVR